MQSAVSQVTVGEEVQLVFCHVNFYIGEESGEEGDDKKGMIVLFLLLQKTTVAIYTEPTCNISLLISLMFL